MFEIEYFNSNEKDIDKIKPLWVQLTEHHKMVSKYFSENYFNFKFEDRKKVLLDKAKTGQMRFDFAQDKKTKQIIGYCVSSITRDKEEGEIDSICIDDAYRGAKIGDQLMKEALNWLDEQGVKHKKVLVAYGNESAFNFYNRFGFYPRFVTFEQK